MCVATIPNTGADFGCHRWREAFDARGKEAAGDRIVPKVFLNATNEKALGKVTLEELKMFASKDA